jgi:hypothetical protein
MRVGLLLAFLTVAIACDGQAPEGEEPSDACDGELTVPVVVLHLRSSLSEADIGANMDAVRAFFLTQANVRIDYTLALESCESEKSINTSDVRPEWCPRGPDFDGKIKFEIRDYRAGYGCSAFFETFFAGNGDTNEFQCASQDGSSGVTLWVDRSAAVTHLWAHELGHDLMGPTYDECCYEAHDEHWDCSGPDCLNESKLPTEGYTNLMCGGACNDNLSESWLGATDKCGAAPLEECKEPDYDQIAVIRGHVCETYGPG